MLELSYLLALGLVFLETGANAATSSVNAATATSAMYPSMSGHVASDGTPIFILNIPGSLGAYDSLDLSCTTDPEDSSYVTPFDYINGDTVGQTSDNGVGSDVVTSATGLDGTKGLTVNITQSAQEGASAFYGICQVDLIRHEGNKAVTVMYSINDNISGTSTEVVDDPVGHTQTVTEAETSTPSLVVTTSVSSEAETTSVVSTEADITSASTTAGSAMSSTTDAVTMSSSSPETSLVSTMYSSLPTAVSTTSISRVNATSSVSATILSTTSSNSSTSILSSSTVKQPPSVTGFDDDGAAGWIITVPKGLGPYANLKLSGSAGGKFDWEQYAEARQGKPDFLGNHRRLEVDVTDFHGDEDYFLTVFGEPHSLTAVETVVATLTLDVEYDNSFGSLRKRAAASAFTLEGTATVTPVVSSSSAMSYASVTSVVSSSIPSSSSSAKSSSSSSSVASSGLLTVVTTVLPSTTVVTVTSCSDGKCTATPVTTGLTTVTDVDTVYTTYCPLTAVATTKTYTPVVLTTTVSAVPESTTTLTITSCSDNKCSATTITTGLAKTTGTVDGTTTVYTTYCPLSDETFTTTMYETSTVVTGSAAKTSAVVSSSSAAPAVASLSTYSGLGVSLTPLAGTIFGSFAFVAALFI